MKKLEKLLEDYFGLCAHKYDHCEARDMRIQDIN